MNIYAESSAVLAWLLGEAAGSRAREVLRHAELVMAARSLATTAEPVLPVAPVTRPERGSWDRTTRRVYSAGRAWRWC